MKNLKYEEKTVGKVIKSIKTYDYLAAIIFEDDTFILLKIEDDCIISIRDKFEIEFNKYNGLELINLGFKTYEELEIFKKDYNLKVEKIRKQKEYDLYKKLKEKYEE